MMNVVSKACAMIGKVQREKKESRVCWNHQGNYDA